MVISQQRTYEDQQYLNQSQNLPQQVEVPSGSHRLRFSWSRTTGWMRIEIPGYENLLVSRLVNEDGSPMRDPQGNPIVDENGNPIENWGRWYFKEYAGKAVIEGTDNPNGVILMHVRSAVLDGDKTALRRPTVEEVPPQIQVAGRLMPQSTYRLCYRRAKFDWRIRDENMEWTDPDALHFVAGYKGDLAGTWFNDPLAHIFHMKTLVLTDGATPCHPTENTPCPGHGVAHLLDASLAG